MKYHSAEDVLNLINLHKLPLHTIALLTESKQTDKSEEEIISYLKEVLLVMFEAIEQGLNDKDKHYSAKIIKHDGLRLRAHLDTHVPICGDTIGKVASYALSTMQINAAMGRIVASPTAGSCGVLPAVLRVMKEQYTLPETTLIEGLLVANVMGNIVAKNATISGAEGGCQAEVGTASAMAAGAAVYMLGGTADQVFHAGAMAFKNLLGLVCDPIAGLVESPCAKRNAMGATNALLCAEMAHSGIKSIVPFDEVVDAMHRIGKVMPVTLRETALGGLAATPTAIQICTEIYETK